MKCSACGADITFITTPSGKSMPCNTMPVTYKTLEKAKRKIVTLDGKVVSCLLNVPPKEMTGYGYTPHWATCSAAREFKRS